MPQDDDFESPGEKVNLIIAEFLEARQRGNAPEINALLSRYPEHARSLRSFFENYQRLKRLAPDPDSRQASTDSRSTASSDTSEVEISGERHRPSSSESQTLPIPAQFGRYRIERSLGKGNMGAVYLAADLQLHRKVAIKVPNASIADNPDLAGRFEREARAAAVLRHPNICTVYDVGEFQGIRFLTMAYIDGASLSEVISKTEFIPPKKAAGAIRKLALALQHAHDHGIVHRDLKSSNVMVDKRGDPIVMDFGLARFTNAAIDIRLTHSGAILGSPAYMSPEHWCGDSEQVGPSSDIYCLGIVFYELLTGRLPFHAPITQLVQQILLQPPPQPSQFVADLPPFLEQICLKMIEKNPADRYQQMSDVADALGNYLRDPDSKIVARSDASTEVDAASLEARNRLIDTTRSSVKTFTDIVNTSILIKPPTRPKVTRTIAVVVGMATLALVAFVVIGRFPADRNRKVDPSNDVTTTEPQPEVQPPQRPPLDETPGKRLRLERTFIGADSPGAALQFSTTGKRVGAAFLNGEVFVWELESGAMLRMFRGDSQPSALFFLSDDELVVASGGDSRQVSLWNVKTGEQTDVFEPAPDKILSASINSTAELFAARTASQGVVCWSLKDRKIKPIAAMNQTISSIAFLPDGKTLVTGHQDGSLSVVPVKTDPNQRPTEKVNGHAGTIADIAPFSNNQHVLTASLNGEIWMWDVQSAQKWKAIGRHEAGVGSVRLLPGILETRYAVCGCLDGLLQIWDLEERRVVHEVGSCSREGHAAVSSDGRWAAVFGESNGVAENRLNNLKAVAVHIWRIPDLPDPRPGFPGFQDPSPQQPQDIKPVPKVTEPMPSNEIPFLEVVHELVGHSGSVTSVCMTADVRFGYSSGGYPKGDGIIRKWDLLAGAPLGFVSVKTDHVTGISITPDGIFLLSGSNQGPVRFWNGDNGTELIRFPAKANATAITQNSEYGYAVADNGSVWVWELEPGKRAKTLSGLESGTLIRLSANEQLVAACGNKKQICIWNANATKSVNKPLYVLECANGPVIDLQFSPDGKHLAAIDAAGNVQSWNLQTNEQRLLPEGHGKNTPGSENSPTRNLKTLTAMAFIEDGEFLITAGRDETFRLWHLPSAREVGRQLVPTGNILSMASARGTNLLFTGGEPASLDPARKPEKSVQVFLWRFVIPKDARP